ADEGVGARGLVGGVELLPRRPSAAQRAEGRARVALGEEDGAGGVVGDGAEERRAEALGDLGQLVGGGTGGGDVAGGEGDLAEGGERGRAVAAALRLARGAADGGLGHRGAALGEAEERQAGVRLPAAAAGLAVRRLRLREGAPQPV